MVQRVSKNPTELELRILKVLWVKGALTGMEISEGLKPGRDLTYQAVMTILGIMEEKGFISRQKAGGRFQYRARVSQQSTSKRMMRELIDRLYEGSVASAMLNLLRESDLSDEELDQLRKLVNSRPEK